MKRIIPCIVLLTLLLACKKDFVVSDITNKTIAINGPSNNVETTANLITFWWDALDGAEKYTLQVVKPDFAHMAQLVLDTSIATNKFKLSLQPGSYQWRIKATNAGYSTAFQTFNLKIDTTNNLGQQLVNLLNPINNFTTASRVITFQWSPVISAVKYELQINGGAVKDTSITGTSLTCTLSAAANATAAYTWNVKAINDISQTLYNPSPFIVVIDLKGPNTPGLTFPANAASVVDSLSLKWTRNSSDVAYDSVYVAGDSLFSSVLNQQVSTQNSLRISSLGLSPSPANTYYWWKVRSFDAVGNPSAYSLKLKFRLTQ